MRTLALDVGEKRIGVAISDETGTIALPHGVVEAGPGDMEAIGRLVDDYEVDRIVVGMPVTLRGVEGPAAQRVAQFAASLRECTSAQVVTWDERLTTVVAEQAAGDVGW